MCVEVKGSRSNNFTDAIQRAIPPQCQIVVTVLDHKTRWVYNDIKKVIYFKIAMSQSFRSSFLMCTSPNFEERFIRRFRNYFANER